MVAGILTAGLLVTGLASGIFLLVRKNRPKLAKENIPFRLGVLHDVPIQPLLDKLNAALDAEFIEQVKQRYLQENPKQTEDDFEWRLFELNRYFLLTNILKKAPMFSAEVDEVWHEMLLFTEKYHTFSQRFLGSMLHHTPNTNPKPEPQERAIFDWVFSQLFTITEFSWKSWGSFFKHPLDIKLLREFKEQRKAALIEKYFKQNEDNREIIDYLLDQMTKQLSAAEKIHQENQKGTFTKQRTFGDMTNLSLVMVFFSYFYFDDYWNYAKVYAYANAAKYTGGCSSAVFCGFGSDGSSNGGGGDSGGSSCSSCGGGCSS